MALTARSTLDRYIKQEYTLGLERTAFELEKNIKEYFGNYRCLIKEEINSRRLRNNNRNQHNDNNWRYNNPIDNNNRGTQTDLIFDGPTSRSLQNNGLTQNHSLHTTHSPVYYKYNRLT